MKSRNSIGSFALSVLIAGAVLTLMATAYAWDSGTVAVPSFNPPPETFTTATLQVKMSCSTSGATIYYTNNGNSPTQFDNPYTGSVTISGTTTLKARAFKPYMNSSATAIATYTQQLPTIATPTLSPGSETFTAASLQVAASCATSGVTIHYTINGNDPTASDRTYSNSSPIMLTGTSTVRAKAFKSGMNPSATAIATYTQQLPTIATPTLSPGSETFTTASLQVATSCATSGAIIHCTVNGNDPTTSDKTYSNSSPIILTGTSTVRAKAFKTGMNPSATAIATYTQQLVKVLTVLPNKLQYAPGDKASFTGTLKTQAGTPVTNTTIGIDNPISQMCVSCTTDSKGNFNYQITVPSTARGNYGLAFYGGNSPVFAVVTVKPTKGLQLTDKSFLLPLGVSTSASSFNVALTKKLTKSTGMPQATLSQQQSALTSIVSFAADAGWKSLTDYVTNPVNDLALLGSVGCVAGVDETGVGTYACAALYDYDIKTVTSSVKIGIIEAIVDKSNLGAADKKQWTDWVNDGSCVIGIALPPDPSDPSAALDSLSTGWTCGSAFVNALTNSSGKKALKGVGLPITNGAFQTGVGFVLLQK